MTAPDNNDAAQVRIAAIQRANRALASLLGPTAEKELARDVIYLAEALAATAERADAADEAVTVLRANHETERRNWEHERELHEAGMRQRAKDLESAEKRHKESLERRDRIAAEQAERADRAEAALLAAQREVDAQMQSKLDAQSLLANIVEAIGLDRSDFDLSDTWRTVGPAILARLAAIVERADEADRHRLEVVAMTDERIAELEAALLAAQQERDEWERRYTDLLERVGGTLP